MRTPVMAGTAAAFAALAAALAGMTGQALASIDKVDWGEDPEPEPRPLHLMPR